MAEPQGLKSPTNTEGERRVYGNSAMGPPPPQMEDGKNGEKTEKKALTEEEYVALIPAGGKLATSKAQREALKKVAELEGSVEGPKPEDDWLTEFNEKTKPFPVFWGWLQCFICLFYQTVMVYAFASESDDFAGFPTTRHFGYNSAWIAYVPVQLLIMAYAWVSSNVIFPRCPTILGISWFLIGFTPALIASAAPYVIGDMGKHFAHNAPLWVLILWGCLRCQFESLVQITAASGVKGISKWLLWPLQSAPSAYSIRYLGVVRLHRPARGGNPDASSSFFLGLPCAIITGYLSPYGENDDNTYLVVLNFVVQTWMFLALLWGPVLHMLGGMPGMTKKNIFFNDAHPRKMLQMHGVFRGVLGVALHWIASYAVIHYLVFLRKLAKV